MRVHSWKQARTITCRHFYKVSGIKSILDTTRLMIAESGKSMLWFNVKNNIKIRPAETMSSPWREMSRSAVQNSRLSSHFYFSHFCRFTFRCALPQFLQQKKWRKEKKKQDRKFRCKLDRVWNCFFLFSDISNYCIFLFLFHSFLFHSIILNNL